jgi:hypothetical protein
MVPKPSRSMYCVQHLSDGAAFAHLTKGLTRATEDITMKSIVILGATIALLGLITFAVPAFNTEVTKDVVRLGDMKVQAKTEETHVVPPILSEGAIALGVLLIGAGVAMSRRVD